MTEEAQEKEFEWLWKMLERARESEGQADHAKKYFFDLLASRDQTLESLRSELDSALKLLATTTEKYEASKTLMTQYFQEREAARSELALKEKEIEELKKQYTEKDIILDQRNIEIYNLKTCMIAAAEEIMSQWPAHCDKEGYGPSNLMHRLEKGIPAEYGYTAGAFEKLISLCEAADKVIEAFKVYRSYSGQPNINAALEVYHQLKNTKP